MHRRLPRVQHCSPPCSTGRLTRLDWLEGRTGGAETSRREVFGYDEFMTYFALCLCRSRVQLFSVECLQLKPLPIKNKETKRVRVKKRGKKSLGISKIVLRIFVFERPHACLVMWQHCAPVHYEFGCFDTPIKTS